MRLKNQIPKLKGNELYRDELINYIDNIVNKFNVVLLNAPAGYGKTTSIISWIESKSINNVSWISLDIFDNVLKSFLLNLLESNSFLDKSIFSDNEKAISENNYTDYILSILENISKIPETIYLIIDDLQIINNTEVSNVFNYLLHNIPSNLKLILLSRNKLKGIYFSELKRRNNFFEIGYEKLRFTNNDVRSYISIDKIRDKDIDIIINKTEGWVFSIQSLNILLTNKDNNQEILKMFSGNNTDIKEFLINETIEILDDKVKDFLLKTSFLKTFNYELCNYVLGIDNSQELINYLIINNLFIISLDDNNDWFRYHDLFSEFLFSMFKIKNSNNIDELYIRVSDWYKLKEDLDESIRYASLIRDYSYIVNIIENNFKKMFSEKKIFKLLDWFNYIPLNHLITYPLSYIYYIKVLNYYIDVDKLIEVERFINEFEHFYKKQNLNDDILVNLYNVKASYGMRKKDYETIKINVDKMSLYTKNDDYESLGFINSFLGVYYIRDYKLEESIESYKKAANFFYKSGDYYNYIFCEIMNIQNLLRSGKLKESQQKAFEIKDLIHTVSIKDITLIYGFLAYIYYMFNDIELCNKYINDGLNGNNETIIFHDLKNFIYILIGIKIKLHLFEEVDFYINKLLDLHYKYKISVETDIINSFNIRKEIRQKKYTNCEKFIGEYIHISKLDDFKKINYVIVFALIESLIFTNNLYEAQNLIDKTIILYKKFIHLLVESYLLKALILYKKKKLNDTKHSIKQALFLGEEGDIIRLFVDSFKEIHKIILDILNNKNDFSQEYINNIKNSFNIRDGNVLSSREIEILKLISEGLSNEQISKNLKITINTVKAHIRHIFRKFGIKRRTQAIEKLKEMSL
ncbi:MAG: LuxR C-terminal-related transcriptional regulator [Candidatus Sericytochromatia bacterium]